MSRSLSHRNSDISDESLSSRASSMISNCHNDPIKLKRSSSKKRKKSKKIRTRKNSTPKNHYKVNLGEARRRSRLSQRNILGHKEAIRPPNILKSFSSDPRSTELFRTPQPKFRAKSKNGRRNSHLVQRKLSKKANNISVAIRLRPLNNGEIRNGMKPIWSVKGTSTLKQIRGTISSYNFEYVCPGIIDKKEGSTLNLYNAIAKRIVLSSCKGINGTIFAYGQTSSGKTYTMLGTDNDPGITLLALSDIFHFIRNDQYRKYALFISYIEIHNEIINDLLNKNNTNLRIIDTGSQNTSSQNTSSSSQGPVIKNCTEKAVKTPSDVIQLLLKGEKIRKVSETHSNQRSSRSHAIFRIFIQSQLRDNNKKNGNHKTLHSVLNLVDLAGSESNSNIDDQNIKQAKEAKHINQSLLCLGRVILALSSKQKPGYIPYRDSKLTRILQQSLGGNANTSVICTMSPCTNCLDESLNTLRFAQFSTKIKCHAVINQTVDNKTKLRKYLLLIKNLKHQINEYTKKSDKMKQVYIKMKRLKKQNASLQTRIKKEKHNRDIMERELADLRRLKIPSKETQSEPEFDIQSNLSGNLSEYSVDRIIHTPSTVHSVVPSQIDQFAKVIMGLQDKLEQVQGNIETLTHRISNAQFVEINSIPSPNLPKSNSFGFNSPKQNLNASNLTTKLMDAMNEFQETQINNAEDYVSSNHIPSNTVRSDIPIISIDLMDTPDLPKERRSDQDQQSAQLLHMISGTRLFKLNLNNDEMEQVKLWLQVQHLLDDSRPSYQICWKKLYQPNQDNPNTVLLSSVITILSGQQTKAFQTSKQKFSEEQQESSFSLILNENEGSTSIDFICINQIQKKTWVQCLNRLLESDTYSQSISGNYDHRQDENVNDSNHAMCSINTTFINEIVDDFFEMEQINPSYPLSPPKITKPKKSIKDSDDEMEAE